MKKTWSKRFLAFSLGLLFVLTSLMLSFAVFFSKTEKPEAKNSDEFVELQGRTTASSVIYGIMPFNFSGNSSEVIPSEDGGKKYLSYKMKDGNSIAYEHDLALAWKTPKADKKDEADNNFFSFTFKFADKNFSSVKFTLETPSTSASKEGKASISITIDNSGNVQSSDSTQTVSVSNMDMDKDITLKLNQDTFGSSVYKVNLVYTQKSSTTKTTTDVGTINDVDGYYTSYRSSNNVTITPLKVEYSVATGSSLLLTKALNGETFTVNDGPNIANTADPIVVPSKQIDYFINGTSFYSNFEYRVIDVMSITLPATDYLGEYKSGTSLADFRADEKNKVENRNTAKIITSGSNKARAVVSLRKGTTENPTYIDFDLGWYLNSNSTTQSTTDTGIAVVDPNEFETELTKGVSMNWSDKTSRATTNTKKENFINQSLEATGYKTTKPTNGNNAKIEMPLGSGAYLYFGDLSNIVTNTVTVGNQEITLNKKDIQYTIYYRVDNGNVQSGGTFSNNQLRLQLNNLKGGGPFTFEIVLVPQYTKGTSKFPMKVGNAEITTDNVFQYAEADNGEKLPIFTFDIYYTGPEVNDSKSVQVGYVNSTYYGVNIEVIGLDNNIAWLEKQYSLYELVTPDTQKSDITRTQILEEMKKLREQNNGQSKIAENEETYNQNKGNYIGYLREIQKEKDGDSAYQWSPDSGSYSFVPHSESYYIVQAKVTSNYSQKEQYGFQAIDVLSSLDSNPGHDPSWVQKNLVSIILFSISGALLIALLAIIFWPNKNKKAKKQKKLVGTNSTIKAEIYEKYKNLFNKK